MSASQDECVAQFARQPICLDRTYARSMAWAAYITAQPLPPTDVAPEKAWVQQRVLAERTPAAAEQQARLLAPYLIEIPNISQRVREHLNVWNTEATEGSLASDIDTSMATVMPTFAAYMVSDEQVAGWCDRNGYPRPPDLVGVTPLVMIPI